MFEKHELCCIFALGASICTFPIGIFEISPQTKLKKIDSASNYVPSSEFQAIDGLFNFHRYPNQKDKVNDQLRNNKIKINHLNFHGLSIEDLDFSDMYLRNMNFSGCRFIRMNFINADLREANFSDCELIESDLEGAVLYYPFDGPKEEVLNKGFRIKNWNNHYDLVRQYSDLMKEIKEKKTTAAEYSFSGLFSKLRITFNDYNSLKNESELLSEKANRFNKLLSCLHLDLQGKNLSDFNLTNLDFSKINLKDTQLQDAWLAENVRVPNYRENYRIELFNKWCNSSEQNYYHSLGSSGFDLFKGVDTSTIQKGLKLKKDLRKANLYGINLQGMDLSGFNLQEANLEGVNLEDTTLIKTNLVKAKIGRIQLSNDFRLPNNCKFKDLVNAYLTCTQQKIKDLIGNILKAKYNSQNELFNRLCYGTEQEQKLCQLLINAGLNIFEKVKPSKLIDYFKINKKLNKADLSNINLQGADLRSCQLENAKLLVTQLQKANLTDANLQNANLSFAQLQQADFTGAYLQGTYLNSCSAQNANFSYAQLQDAHLYQASLQDADLSHANFQGADLYSAFLQRSNLSFAKLQNTDLRQAQLNGANMKGAMLGGARLSLNYYLPPDCTDENLVTIYHSCDDSKAEKLLKDILEAKEISIQVIF